MNAIVEFKRDLGSLIEKKELALPSTVSPEAFKNAAIVAVQDNTAILRDCDKASVFKAIRTLAGAGLVPDGREAAIVPFKGKAQAMPMVAGLIKVARNSGQIKSIWTEVVYEGEMVNVRIEDGERKWDHINVDGSPINAMDRGGEIIGAYAVAKLKDDTVEFQPMSRQEIEKRRKASSNQRGEQPTGVWANWYDEMAKKTVIRNLCKRLPMSTEDMNRIMVEEDSQPIRDVTPQDQPPRENLAQRLAQQEAPAEDKPEVLDGEIVSDKHWTEEVDTSDGFPGDDSFTQGVKAFQEGVGRIDCPYQSNDEAAVHWLGGWDQGEKAAASEDQA